MFNKQYIIEVVAKSYVDVRFDVNTPLQPTQNNRLEQINKATVFERKTGVKVKEYTIYLDGADIRSVQNPLREKIEEDFNITDFSSKKNKTNLKKRLELFNFGERECPIGKEVI